MSDKLMGMKKVWVRGMEAIGNAAAGIANGTKTKVNEINMVSRRSELFSDLSRKAYELWQKGVELPEELTVLLSELDELDEKLAQLRASRVAEEKVAPAPAEDAAAPAVAETAPEPAEEIPAIVVTAAVEADGAEAEPEETEKPEE